MGYSFFEAALDPPKRSEVPTVLRIHAFGFLVFVLTFAASDSSAQDRCLEGASTLGDRRALAQIQLDTETACPCASFDGGPGAKRSHYRRCAREVVETALDAAALRSPCKRTAVREIRGAVCGSDRIACGGFRENRKNAIQCRTRSESRCVDRGQETRNRCSLDRCSDVVSWTAGTCVDARAFGPLAASARTVTMTKPSAVTPAEDRVLDVVVWYPGIPDGSPVSPGVGAPRDLAMDLSGAPYPILMFSHGSCGVPTQSTFMTPLLASHGFIVIAPPHPGNTLFDFPSCGTPAAQVASAIERPKDIRFALDTMLAANGDGASPFFGSMDPDRIAMSGHSFGGFTTYLVVPQDVRYRAAMPLAAAVPPGGALHIPSLTILGQIDSVVSNAAIRAAYEASTGEKYRIEIENTGHYAFSDACFPSPDCAPPDTLTQSEAHDLVLRWALPFLKVFLTGDESFRPFLVAPPPGSGVAWAAETP